MRRPDVASLFALGQQAPLGRVAEHLHQAPLAARPSARTRLLRAVALLLRKKMAFGPWLLDGLAILEELNDQHGAVHPDGLALAKYVVDDSVADEHALLAVLLIDRALVLPHEPRHGLPALRRLIEVFGMGGYQLGGFTRFHPLSLV